MTKKTLPPCSDALPPAPTAQTGKGARARAGLPESPKRAGARSESDADTSAPAAPEALQGAQRRRWTISELQSEVRKAFKRREDEIGPRIRCQGRRRSDGKPCEAKSEPGKRFCKWHGGCATGPTTADGRARALANLEKGRATRLANLKAARDRARQSQDPTQNEEHPNA